MINQRRPPPLKKLRVEDALAYLDQVKTKYKDNLKVYQNFLDVMRDFKDNKIDTPGVIIKVMELFKGDNNLILGFNAFLPPGCKIELPETEEAPIKKKVIEKNDPSAAQKMDFDQAIQYVTKIKSRFENNLEDYRTFLKILTSYQQNQITLKKVYEQVSELFKSHPDLLAEFLQFLPVNMRDPPVSQKKEKKRVGPKPAPTTGGTKRTSARRQEENKKNNSDMNTLSLETHATAQLFESIKKQLNNDETYQEFLKCVNLFSNGVIGKQELIRLANDIIGQFTDSFKSFKKLVSTSSSAFEDKFEKSKESNFKQSSRFGPSYRSLPDGFPRSICSERDDLCNSVLNDEYVSFVAGTEEEGGESYRKTATEEIIFQCEDDRSELDIVIEQNISTIQFLTPVCEKIEAEQPFNFKLEDLREIHRASIARIYGDKGHEILEGLRKNPQVAIPIILRRLNQKDQEWSRARKELNKFWREVYEKNHKKSFETRSIELKNQEKKFLNPKNLLADIEELNSYNRTIQVKAEQLAIHHDIFSIILQVSDLNDEQNEKLKIFWKTFLLPFLDIHLDTKELNSVSDLTRTYPQLCEQQTEKKGGQIFYGNSSLFVFLRGYLILYERLQQAKELANSEIPLNTDATIFKEYEKTVNGGTNDEEDIEEKSPFKRLKKEEIYPKFLSILVDLLENSIDNLKYESECEQLLGYQSFTFHTLDKLVTMIQRQLFTVLNDTEICSNLIKAYIYERKRENPFTDESYIHSAQNILENEKCYKFTNDNQVIDISMVDLPFFDVKKRDAEDKAFQYIEEFISMNQETESLSNVFLQRTLNKKVSLENAIIQNELECKICIATFKMFYVEDTEDFFYKNTKKEHKKQKKKSLKKWTEKKLKDMGTDLNVNIFE
eukprot:gene9115-1205_t